MLYITQPVNWPSQGHARLTNQTPRAQASRSDPTRAECLRVPRANRPHMSQPTPCASTHTAQPFSIFAQSFGASAIHFLNSLSHLVIVNSAIFGIVNSVSFSYSKLSYFSYKAQSFYNFVSHSATVNSAILLENSVIRRCYSAHPFLLKFSAIFATLLSFFLL
jgi:hypothetical protein